MSTIGILSNKESALMGLLSERDMYAYEINQEIKQRSMREWTELSLSSIYKILRKLEKKELLTSKMVLSEKNLVQKVYSITEKGLTQLKTTLKFIISNPEHLNWRMDIAISNLNLLTEQEIVEGFSSYVKKLKEAIQCYRELEDYLIKHQCPDHAISLSTRPRYFHKAEINWVKDYLESLDLSLETHEKGVVEEND
ncbi:MAG: PadR family transcriptional regulator [Promethearchaeota archaeon]